MSPLYAHHNGPQNIQSPVNPHSLRKKFLLTLLTMLITGIVCLNLNRDAIADMALEKGLPGIKTLPTSIQSDKFKRYFIESDIIASPSQPSPKGAGQRGWDCDSGEIIQTENPLFFNDQPIAGQQARHRDHSRGTKTEFVQAGMMDLSAAKKVFAALKGFGESIYEELHMSGVAEAAEVDPNKKQTLEGEFQILEIDDFERGESRSEFILQTDDGTMYKIDGSMIGSDLNPGVRIRIERALVEKSGMIRTGDIVVDQASLKKVLMTTQDSPALGPQNVLVIPVNFQNYPSRPWTKEQLETTYFSTTNPLSVTNYYKENSYGKTWYTGEIFDNSGEWYTLPFNKPTRMDSCGSILMGAAIKAADPDIQFIDDQGKQVFQRIIVTFPYCDNAPGGGYANVGLISVITDEGTFQMGRCWMNGDGTSSDLATHELGHVLGSGHAWAVRYRQPWNYTGPDCDQTEYGNYYDNMGGSYMGHFSAIFKDYLPWFEDYNVLRVQEDGIYEIDPIEIKSSRLQALRIKGSDTEDTTKVYYVEWRKPIGFDKVNYDWDPSRWTSPSGILVTYFEDKYSPAGVETYLLAWKQPNTFLIPEGGVFFDAQTGLRIAPIAESDSTMQVKVDLVSALPNIQTTAQTTQWPSELKVKREQGTFNYQVTNNYTVGINEPLKVGLFVKAEGKDWQLVPGQTVEISSFAVGESKEGLFTWTPQAKGTYEIRIISDYEDKVAESLEEDNNGPGQSVHQVNVVNPPIDIAVTAGTWPTVADVGQPVRFGVNVKNQGTEGTGSFAVALNIDGKEVSRKTVTNLAGGQNQNVELTWVMECGVHSVEIRADVDDAVPETEEEINNVTPKKVIWHSLSSECGNEYPVAASVSNEENPDAGEGGVVYQDKRSGNYDIYYKDFMTGEEILIAGGIKDQISPNISEDGKLIAWLEEGDLYGSYERGEIRRITTTPRQSIIAVHDVSGTRILYHDYAPNDKAYFVYDYATSQRIRTLLPGELQCHPRMDGELIVHETQENGNGDIKLNNYVTREKRVIVSGPEEETSPDKHGDMVVYIGKSEGRDEIYVTDTEGALPRKITDNVENIVYKNPQIYGPMIVWQAGEDSASELRSYDLNTGREDIVTSGGREKGYGAIHHAVSKGYVVWEDYRNGDADIFMMKYDYVPLAVDPEKENPKHFALLQNYPNPFSPTTTISYEIARPVDVSLKIYNVLGQEVKTLVNEFKPAGKFQAIWDGTDNSGRPAAEGMYFYRIQAGDFVQTKKIILMR